MNKGTMIILLVLAMILLLTGCTYLSKFLPGAKKPEEPETPSQGESSGPKEEDLSTLTWTKDVPIGSSFTPQTKLSEVPLLPLGITADEAEPIRLELWEEEDRVSGIDSSAGGVEADVSYAKISDESLKGLEDVDLSPLKQALEEWNNQARARAELEKEEGVRRHRVYQSLEKETKYIFLTSWISMQVARCDTQMVSYMSEVYRYNRNYEPNFYEIHSVTMDPLTGKRYSLNDFFTDTQQLADKIAEAYLAKYQKDALTQEQTQLVENMRQAIEGCRDDGSFAWVVYPEGIQFVAVGEKKWDDGTLVHDLTRIFVPFLACEDFLREDITEVSYDYLYDIEYTMLPMTLGFEAPEKDDGSFYTMLFLGQKNGEKYIYACEEEYTLTFAIWDEPVYMSETVGEIASRYNERYFTMYDPERIPLACQVSLSQELFLEGWGRIAEDGTLEKDGLLTNRGGMPFCFIESVEAEIFPDEESTESEMGVVEPNDYLTVIRSDGETFIDCLMEAGTVCRLYIEGSPDEGWWINGIPKIDIVGNEGYFEE